MRRRGPLQRGLHRAGLDVVTGAGTRLRLGPGTAPTDGVLADLHRLVAAELATIRTELGRFGRQVSGYSLEHLLPERGFDVARALVGSEGTLALVLGATVRLVTDSPYRGLANKQIARVLGIREGTVKAHLTSVFQRIGVRDRTSAALWARAHLPSGEEQVGG